MSFTPTWDGVCRHTMTFYDEDEDPSSCWCGSAYLRHLSGISADPEAQKAFPNLLSSSDEILAFKDGIYHFFMTADEDMHYFTLEISDSQLKVWNTYGGSPGLFSASMIKSEWTASLAKFLTKITWDTYRTLFGLPKTACRSKSTVVTELRWAGSSP